MWGRALASDPFERMILRPCGNGTSTALHFSGGMVHQQHLMASTLRPSGIVHQIFLWSRMILRPSGNGASTAHRGQDLKILCLPAEEVPPLRPSGNDQKILCPQAEEVPLLRPSGMVLRPRGNGTSTALHFPGQAAWISRGGHTSQARWQWYIGGTLRPHLSGQMTWYINCSLNWTWMGSLRPCRRVPPPGGELL